MMNHGHLLHHERKWRDMQRGGPALRPLHDHRHYAFERRSGLHSYDFRRYRPINWFGVLLGSTILFGLLSLGFFCWQMVR